MEIPFSQAIVCQFKVRGRTITNNNWILTRQEWQKRNRAFNRETYARGRETFDRTYLAFKSLLLGIWRREELAGQEANVSHAKRVERRTSSPSASA